jgi:hypothetical protein
MGIGAYEIPSLRFSLPAGADVARFRFVKVNADGAGELAGADDIVIGASMNQAAEGEVLEVADGIVIIEAGGAIEAGASIAPDADGKATAGNGALVALTAATAAGEFVTVKI